MYNLGVECSGEDKLYYLGVECSGEDILYYLFLFLFVYSLFLLCCLFRSLHQHRIFEYLTQTQHINQFLPHTLIRISLHPEGANLWYFKHEVFDLTEFTENVERHVRLSYRGVTKILWGGGEWNMRRKSYLIHLI